MLEVQSPGRGEHKGRLKSVGSAPWHRTSAFIIAMLLASLNSCCNPWIYMFFAGHLFHGVLRHFLCCSSRYLKTSQCSCELRSARKGTSSTLVMKSSGSQRSVTQTSVA